MQCRSLLIVAGVSLAFVMLLRVSLAGVKEEEPKFTIKEVMEKAHKNKLLNKVADGKGTKADAEELLALYEALAAHKPPKGDADAFKKKGADIVAAAKDVVAGKEGSGAKLTKAANCAACHKDHKGK